MSASGSQGWLKGQNVPIDSFFTRVGASSSSSAGGKRKRESSGRGGADTTTRELSSKRLKACGENKLRAKANISNPVRDCDAPPFASCSKARSKDRNALDDVTARQNNQRTRARMREGLVPRSGRSSPWRKSGSKPTRSEVIPASDSLDESDDAPPRALVFNPTPSRTFETGVSHIEDYLLTPPPSSIAMNRTKGCEPPPPKSSPNILSFPKLVFNRTVDTVAHTPSTLSSTLPVKSYPTPESMSFPRLKLSHSSSSSRPLPALKVHLESASFPLFKDDDVESHNGCDDISSPEVPSSQTQYLHYSPKKKTAFSVMRFKPPSQSVIPSSQSQPSILSPRKIKKPAPLSIQWDSRESGPASLNVVVPTSQEDELEISLQNVVDPRLSQLPGEHTVVDSVKDVPEEGTKVLSLPEMSLCSNAQLLGSNLSIGDVSTDALPEVEEAPASPLLRVAEGLEVRCDISAEDPHDVNLRKATKEHWQSDFETQSSDNPNLDTSVMMQSSMTEPDSWNEDPFASTNRAYMDFLSPRPSTSQRSERRITGAGDTSVRVDNNKSGVRSNEPVGLLTCTQGSATQADTDDEDPFPTLPPVSTVGSSVDKTTLRKILPPSQKMQETPKEADYSSRQLPSDVDQSQTGDQTQSQDYASQIQSMPEIGSLDDSFDVKAISPHRIVARMHRVLGGKFKRQDSRALDESYALDAGESDFESSGVGSMPAVVRDFLDMFDSQTQDDGDTAFLP